MSKVNEKENTRSFVLTVNSGNRISNIFFLNKCNSFSLKFYKKLPDVSVLSCHFTQKKTYRVKIINFLKVHMTICHVKKGN